MRLSTPTAITALAGTGGNQAGNALAGSKASGAATAPLPAAMTDIHDIRSAAEIPVDLQPLLLVSAMLVAVGLAGWLLWRWHRQRKQHAATAPPLPPHRTALEKLDRLGDPSGKTGRIWYFRLSAILREYLKGRFGMDAPEMTSEELLAGIRKLGLAEPLVNGVKRFVSDADPVKYAGQESDAGTMRQHLGFVRTLVEETTAAEDSAKDLAEG